MGIVTECFGEWKYLFRPGAGAWARGPAAVGVAELGGDTGPPEATGAGGPRAAERFTSGRKGAMSRRSSASRARVALIRVAARYSAGRPAWAARGAPCDRARQLSESNLRGLREASPVGHVPRRGDRGKGKAPISAGQGQAGPSGPVSAGGRPGPWGICRGHGQGNEPPSHRVGGVQQVGVGCSKGRSRRRR